MFFQCKMCGGNLEITAGSTVAQCESCGVKQTIPHLDDDKKALSFQRANGLRTECEFDKAAMTYEAIIADYPREAEAYWGMVLCTYGIEYVNDPQTGAKIPTCHRASYQSIYDNPDYQRVLQCADPVALAVYQQEAVVIEKLRRDIFAISAAEEPYDVFICYKETASDGQRTLDSVLAQELYKDLTDEGYRVFFSRISLEKKLGEFYEPYIFSALNSAKVMLVVGTSQENFQSVWVKNEWSRFLKLMDSDREKYLIPCFKGMDPYSMPREFIALQAQDLGKIGCHQDILWGIQKLIPKKETPEQPTPEPVSEPKTDRARPGTVILAVFLCFFAIIIAALTSASMEERPEQFLQDTILNLIWMQLLIPAKMLISGLYLRKKYTQADIRTICTSTIVLCVILGIGTFTTLEDLAEFLIFGNSADAGGTTGIGFPLIAAVLQIIMYKLSKSMLYRICKISKTKKK